MRPSNRHQIDLEQVAGFLRARGWRVGSTISPSVHGEWSRAFRFTVDDDAEYVVRFSAFDDDFRKDQRAARYTTPALPIPSIVELGQAFDGFYAISRRVRGTFLDALDGQQLQLGLPSLFGAIDGMRQADVSASNGFGVWNANGRAPHASWSDALRALGADTTGSRIAVNIPGRILRWSWTV